MGMSEQDTREQLEADVREFFDGIRYGFETAVKWLNRQAAITAEETSDAWEEYRDATQREIAELTAERDELQAAIYAMGNGQFYAMYKAKRDECEQLKKVVRTQAESFKKLECELAGKQ